MSELQKVRNKKVCVLCFRLKEDSEHNCQLILCPAEDCIKCYSHAGKLVPFERPLDSCECEVTCFGSAAQPCLNMSANKLFRQKRKCEGEYLL